MLDKCLNGMLWLVWGPPARLTVLSLCRAPLLRSNIRDRLRKRPPMAGKVLGGVQPLPEGHGGQRLDNARPESLGMIAMPLDVFDAHKRILVDLIRARRPKIGSCGPDHDIPTADRELRVRNPGTGPCCPETLGESESPAQPLNCSTHVLID